MNVLLAASAAAICASENARNVRAACVTHSQPLTHTLPPHHKVYSVLILGYPQLKFLRAVDRKPIEVTWE